VIHSNQLPVGFYMNNISAATEFAGSEQIGHCFLFNPQCCVSHDLLGKQQLHKN